MTDEEKNKVYKMANEWLVRETGALPNPKDLHEELEELIHSPEAQRKLLRQFAVIGIYFAKANREDLLVQLDQVVKGWGIILNAWKHFYADEDEPKEEPPKPRFTL